MDVERLRRIEQKVHRAQRVCDAAGPRRHTALKQRRRALTRQRRGQFSPEGGVLLSQVRPANAVDQADDRVESLSDGVGNAIARRR